MKRHVVLVGLPGSGKTTVGRLLAPLLDTTFADLDEAIVATAGMPVTAIFERQGEAAFRLMERAAMDRALGAPAQVIAPGAGWIAEPGNLEGAPGALLVYLRIDPEVAAARLEGDATRPLLTGAQRTAKLQELLAVRKSWYERSAFEVDASRRPDAVAAEIVRLATPSGKS